MNPQGWTKNQLIEQATEMIRKGNNALEFALSLPGEVAEPQTKPNGKLFVVAGNDKPEKPLHASQTAAARRRQSKIMKAWWKNHRGKRKSA